MLCLSQDREDTGTNTTCFGAGPGNLVCVNCVGGIGICMAKFVCGCDRVNTTCNQNRCYRMTEGMGMDVGQIVFLTELIQPICDANPALTMV